MGNPALAPAAAVMQQHRMLLWGEAANQRAAWAGGGGEEQGREIQNLLKGGSGEKAVREEGREARY